LKLHVRMLLIFGITVLGGMAALYFVTRELLLSSFRHLEVEQMEQKVVYAQMVLDEEYRALATTTSDYAYWDRMYEFLGSPAEKSISDEFQSGQLQNLRVNLVVIRDREGNVVFEKAEGLPSSGSVHVPDGLLDTMRKQSALQLSSVQRQPRDGVLQISGGAYLVSIRPVLTSERSGEPRGTLLMGRQFGEDDAEHIEEITRSPVTFKRVDSPQLPTDFREALGQLLTGTEGIAVRPMSRAAIGGYGLIRNVFGEPLFILRVDTPRPIFERGELSVIYLFGTLFIGALLASLMIFYFLQRYVLSRVETLSREVKAIGNRKAISERVRISGHDEISSLGGSINDMLAELERTNSQFLFLVQNIHQVFWIRDARTGQFEYINQVYETIWGRSCESLQKNPHSWQEQVHKDDLEVCRRMQAQQDRGEPSEGYYRLLSSSGTLHWLLERTFPAFDAQGRLKQIIGLTEDVTDFKLNEQELLRAQQELEQRVEQRTAEVAERAEVIKLLLDSAPGAIYGNDDQGLCTFCNPACLRVLGYDNESELLGKNCHALFHHTKADGTPYPEEQCPIYGCFRGGHEVNVDDEVFWRKDGTSFPAGYGSRQVRRNGKVVGAVVSFADLTNRKRHEMELRHSQKLEAVGRLAAGIAHEINTPIQFVSDNTRFLRTSFQDELLLVQKYQKLYEAAKDGKISGQLLDEVAAAREHADWPYLEEEIPKATEQMLEGLGRVSTIVRGMKEFSHVDRTHEKAPADLNRALESTLIVARNELKYCADIETNFEQLPPVVCHLGDLNQVFLNLFVNAAHAIEDAVKGTTRRGKIAVGTRLDGATVQITISDTGTGIPEEARDKIFDPFFTTKEVGRGTGQGLALARTIVVEKHGGMLTFETEMGKGTTFIIRLPLAATPVREEALVR